MGWILALTPTLGNAGNGAGNVLTKIHDLLLYSIPQLAKMPRDQKYLLGDRIETKMLEVLEHAIRASYRKDKRPHLVEADMALEIIRHLVRLAYGLRHLSPKADEVMSERVDEIGRMIGGRLKAASITDQAKQGSG